MGNKTFSNVKIYMTLKTTTTRANLSTSSEDLAAQLGKIKKWYDDFAWSAFTAPTVEVTGSGNAFTTASWDVSTGKLTLTKGSTFLTQHPTIPVTSDTTSTATPSFGGTFTVVDSVTRDANGHVTTINVKTVTIPDGDGVYIPLTGSNDISGNLKMNTTTRGYWLKDNTGYQFPGIYHNGTNIWIGASQTNTKHFTGNTMISAGYNANSNKGNITAWLYLVNSENTSATGYPIFNSKNLVAGTGLTRDTTSDTTYDGYVYTINHSNSVTAVSTEALMKFAYDAQGHITSSSAATGSDLPSHTHAYLPLAGGTMNANAEIIIPNGNNDSKINYTSISYKVGVTGGWARGFNFYSDDFSTRIGSLGVFGQINATEPDYMYFGKAYDNNWHALYKNKHVITDSEENGFSFQYKPNGLSNNISGDFITLVPSSQYGYGILIGKGHGGLTMLGAGESMINFTKVAFDSSTSPYNVTFSYDSESLIQIADQGIWFVTGADSLTTTNHTDWTHLKTVILDANGYFRPSIDNKGQIGTSNYRWNWIYATRITAQLYSVPKAETQGITPLIIQNTMSTSNYVNLVKWFRGGSSMGSYGGCIGFHSTGGDTTTSTGDGRTDGAIIAVPYATDSTPYGGSVGLYIGRHILKLDGREVYNDWNSTGALCKTFDAIDAVGWYRIMSFPVQGSATSGKMLSTLEITVIRNYNNRAPEAFAVRLVGQYGSTENFNLLWSKQYDSNSQLFTQIRVVKSSDSKTLYMDLYYNATVANGFTVYCSTYKPNITHNNFTWMSGELVTDSLTAVAGPFTIQSNITYNNAWSKTNSEGTNTSYWGPLFPNGAYDSYMRTSTAGIIPYKQGGFSSPNSSIGTSTWAFNQGYIKTMYSVTNVIYNSAYTKYTTITSDVDSSNKTVIIPNYSGTVMVTGIGEALTSSNNIDMDTIDITKHWHSPSGSVSETIANSPVMVGYHVFNIPTTNAGGTYQKQLLFPNMYQIPYIYRYRGGGAWDHGWRTPGTGFVYVIGTQSSSTAEWTGELPLPALYDGLTIAYYLPYASVASTNVTLNLTLSNSTSGSPSTTGPINVYYTGTSRMTTHYGAGSTIILTYFSAGSISVSGTATTDARWTHSDYNSNTNTAVNVTLDTSTKAYLLATTSTPTSTATARTAVADTAIYMHTEAGTIHATAFKGDLNGTINTATTATTQDVTDSSTKVATTAFVTAKKYESGVLYAVNSTFDSHPWGKVAECTVTTASATRWYAFRLYQGYQSTSVASSLLLVRWVSSSSKVYSNGSVYWLHVNYNIDIDNVAVTYTDVANTSTTIQIWIKATARYQSWQLVPLYGGWASGSGNVGFTYYRITDTDGAATYTGTKIPHHVASQWNPVKSKSGGQYIAARDNAPVQSNAYASTSSGFYPAIACKTNAGSWSIGSLGSNNDLYLSYTTDANYSSSTNTFSNYSISTAGAFSGTASAWTTARTLTLGSGIEGSVSVKGNAAMTLNANLRSGFRYKDASTWNSTPWHMVATWSSAAKVTTCATFLVYAGFSSGYKQYVGILYVLTRSGSTAGTYDSSKFYWLTKTKDINLSDFVLTWTTNVDSTCKFELYWKQPDRYTAAKFTLLSCKTGNSTNFGTAITFTNNSTENVDFAAIPSTITGSKTSELFPGEQPLIYSETASNYDVTTYNFSITNVFLNWRLVYVSINKLYYENGDIGVCINALLPLEYIKSLGTSPTTPYKIYIPYNPGNPSGKHNIEVTYVNDNTIKFTYVDSGRPGSAITGIGLYDFYGIS